MIIAEFLGLFTKTSKPVQVAEGVPATETKATKITRYRYLVKAETLEELAAYVASQGEFITYLDDDQSKPLYFSSKLHAAGWVELAFSKEGFVYPKDDLTAALIDQASKLGGDIGKAAAAQIWEETSADIRALFPKKAKPSFASAKPVITDPAGASNELGQTGKTE